MSDASAGESIVPFESASELREAHARLLERLDELLGQDPAPSSEAAALEHLRHQIQRFLARGVETGVYLEEIRERTACQMLLDYWVSNLAQAGLQVSGARLARFDGEKLPDLKDKCCPYVGLDAFRERTYFFGRDADIEALAAQVRGTPLVVVLGASGSGKSSLVMAGVLPEFAAGESRPSLRIVRPFVPGDDVLYALADAVLEVCDAGDDRAAEAARLRQDPRHLRHMVGGAEANPTLITIDQFEEIFTLSDIESRTALVANLVHFLEAGRDHRVILTVREEFGSRIVELRELGVFLDKAWYSMRPMGYEELKAAVEKPAAAVNLQFQSGIADDLVKNVLGQHAALPLLQFTLRSLWEKRDRNRITWEVYRRVGDPLHALKASADQFFDSLAPQTQDEVKRILLELVRVDELLEAYRQPVPKNRLLQAGKANTEEVLALLAKLDFVRITPGTGEAGAVVEVKHESLVRNWPRFVAWIDQKRQDRRQRLVLSQAANRWVQSEKPPEGLLTGWQLQEAKDQPDLSESEMEFIQASTEAVDRAQREREEILRREAEQAKAMAAVERKLLKSTRLALGFMLVAAVLIAAAAVHYRRVANGQSRESARLASEAIELASQRKDVEEKFIKLQADYNELFARQVSQAVAPERLPSAGRQVTIFLHISEERQRPRAEEIARLLRQNKIAVPGIQRVKPVSSSNVRYFHPEDRRGAVEIVRLLNEYLRVNAVQPTFIEGFQTKVPGRQYEIWFAPDSLANAAK